MIRFLCDEKLQETATLVKTQYVTYVSLNNYNQIYKVCSLPEPAGVSQGRCSTNIYKSLHVRPTE